MPQDKYFDVLGIPVGSSEEEIKKAYKNLARQWHPDKNKENSQEATIKFQEISQAYSKLIEGDESDDEGHFTHFDAEALFRQFFSGNMHFVHQSSRSNQFHHFTPGNIPHFGRAHGQRGMFGTFGDSDDDYEDEDYGYFGDDRDYYYSSDGEDYDDVGREARTKDAMERPSVECTSITDTSLHITWGAPPLLPDADVFSLEMDSSGYPGMAFEEIYRGNKKSFAVKNLKPGTQYYFLVRTIGSDGKPGKFSQVANFTTTGSQKKRATKNARVRNNSDRKPPPKIIPTQPQPQAAKAKTAKQPKAAQGKNSEQPKATTKQPKATQGKNSEQPKATHGKNANQNHKQTSGDQQPQAKAAKQETTTKNNTTSKENTSSAPDTTTTTTSTSTSSDIPPVTLNPSEVDLTEANIKNFDSAEANTTSAPQEKKKRVRPKKKK